MNLHKKNGCRSTRFLNIINFDYLSGFGFTEIETFRYPIARDTLKGVSFLLLLFRKLRKNIKTRAVNPTKPYLSATSKTTWGEIM